MGSLARHACARRATRATDAESALDCVRRGSVDPDRFLPERRAGWHRFAYFPFGGGTKKCLGDAFAPFEAVLLMAAIGRRWRLRPAPGHRVRPDPKATLKPRGGMPLVLQAR